MILLASIGVAFLHDGLTARYASGSPSILIGSVALLTAIAAYWHVLRLPAPAESAPSPPQPVAFSGAERTIALPPPTPDPVASPEGVSREPFLVRPEDKPPPKGIGGWLVLPAIGTVIAPFVLAFGAKDVFSVLPQMALFEDKLKAVISAEVIANAVLIAWALWTIYLLFKHKRQFPRAFCYLFIGALALSVFDLAAAAAMFGSTPSPNDIRDIGRTVVSCLVWVPYMLISKRVKNTFVQP